MAEQSAQARIVSGTWVAKALHGVIRNRVAELTPTKGRPPGLGVILVGDNPASKTYVASKEKTARACGLESFATILPASASFAQVADAIDGYNADPRIDGILLQLPLPPHLQSAELIAKIDPAKDADGLHAINQGLLMQGRPATVPCTPRGVMSLIDVARAGIITEPGSEAQLPAPCASLKGASAVVIGRSILVGRPVALLLLERDATVTIAHSKTADLPSVVREADIVIAAVGVPKLVKRDWIKRGAVVIDVGINRLSDGSLCGDVDFEGVREVAGAVSPVPGGVGPMTVAMLIQNTVEQYARS